MNSNPLESLQRIADIRLSHMEHECDENYEGEWEYRSIEVEDGTVEECFHDDIDTINKALQAMRIIVDKKVDTRRLRKADNLSYYNNSDTLKRIRLTQDEFDLLKEALR